MRAAGATLLAAALLATAACGGSSTVLYGIPQDIDYSDPGELPIRAEIRTLPFKHIVWEYKYPDDLISRATLGLEHLYLETPENAVIAINRFTGHTAWKFHIDSGTPLDWAPVEARGVPEAIRDLEEKLRLNKREIDDVVAARGPGPESEKLWKTRDQLREQLKVAQFGDNVYFISLQVIFCLDRRTGNLRWKRRLNFAPSARPYAIRNQVFVSAADFSRVWVLNAEKKGNPATFFRSAVSVSGKNHIMNQPIYAEPTLFFVSHDGCVYAFDVGERIEKWRYRTERAIKADPVVHRFTQLVKDAEGKERPRTHNLLLVGGMDNAFYAVDADGGVLRWKYECGAPIRDRAEVRDFTVYFKSEEGALFAMELNPMHVDENGTPTGPVRSGRMRWKLPLGEKFLVKGKNFVAVLGPNHVVYTMDEITGDIRGRYPIKHMRFLVTNTLDDVFYVVHPAGYVFALRESKERY